MISTNGRYGTLARRWITRDSARPLGRPRVVAPDIWNFTAIKQEIFAGRVPAELRNLAHPIWGEDGTIWLLIDAEAGVEQYSPADSLRWRKTLEEPELASVKADFFASNRQDSAGFRFAPLNYFHQGVPVDRNLWLLLQQSDTTIAAILILDHEGNVTRRVRVPVDARIRAFAVDGVNRWLYLLGIDDVLILRARIPESLLTQ